MWIYIYDSIFLPSPFLCVNKAPIISKSNYREPRGVVCFFNHLSFPKKNLEKY